MKNFISLFISLCLICSMCVFAAGEAISSELVPVVSQNHTLTQLQDFDSNYNSDLWTKNWGAGFEISDINGNNVMKISPVTAVELKQTMPNEGVVEFNAKMDYKNGAYTHIMDIGYNYSVTGDTAYAVYMVKTEANPNGIIAIDSTGSKESTLNNTYISHQLSVENKYFDGEWFNVRAEFGGYFVNIYLNGELCIEFNNLGGNGKTDCRQKYLGFTSSLSTLYIDNVTISTANIPEITEPGAVQNDLIPVPEQDTDVIAKEDFDTNYSESNWKNVWSTNDCGVVVAGEGNNAYYTGKSTDVLYSGATLPERYTIQANVFLNYVSGSWPRVMDIAYSSYDVKYQLNLANDATHPYGKIVFQGKGKTNNTAQYYYLTKAQKEEFFGKWIKITAKVDVGHLEIYFNDTKVVDYDKFVNANGLAFYGSLDKVYIDNLLITKGADAPVPVVEKDQSRYTIVYQDFENLKTGSLDELYEIGYKNCYKMSGEAGVEGCLDDGFGDSENAFNFIGTYALSGLELGDEYTVEMNVKFEFDVNNGTYTSSYPSLKLNKRPGNTEYSNEFYFNVDGSIQFPSYRILKGAETVWAVREAASATFDIYESNGKWAYLKLEKTADSLKFYWNNKEYPAYTYTFTGEALSGGYFQLYSSKARKMVIDNLYISTSDIPKDISLSTNLEESEDSGITYKTYIKNNSLNDCSVNCITAVYKNKTLYASDISERIFLKGYDTDGSGGETSVVPAEFNLTGNISDYKFKTILVDSMESLKPVCDTFSYPEVNLYLVGDSLTASYAESLYPLKGWGDYIYKSLEDNVNVYNKAVSGTSTKTYYSTYWDDLKSNLKSGDWVMLSLMANDKYNSSLVDVRTTIEEYEANLKKYITETRAKGAEIIFITSPNGCSLQNTMIATVDGVAYDYPASMKKIAAEYGVVLLDVNTISLNHNIAQGIAKIKNTLYLFNLVERGLLTQAQLDTHPHHGIRYQTDYTHFAEEGAIKVAEWVAGELAKSDSEFKKYLK